MSTIQTTRAAATRGDRLNPPRYSRIYVMLWNLRRAVESIVANDLPTGGGLTLLDYGCGNMPYRPIFEARGVKYIGADMPGGEVATVLIDPTGRVDLADASCDIVLSTQVLEHVVSPDTYLEECKRLLRPGGKLILSTHGFWQYHPDPTDFWRWTGDGLRRVVELHGFKVERTIGILGLSAAALQLFQDSLHFRMPRLIRDGFALVMQLMIKLFDRIHTENERGRDSAIFVVVATRREDTEP